MRFLIVSLLNSMILFGQAAYVDSRHPSKIFNESRNYRIFLPRDYAASDKRYPVIYYFHGHSDRYTLEHYDKGLDTVPKIAAFVASHDVIVVAADGYVARDYTGFYGGTPYDVRREGGDFDYGEYFLELMQHVDSTYRTLTTRRYRATSGLSMGGYMSLYLSARYPEIIGSASAFNPGPEFYAGEKGRRSLWRPKDHVASHQHSVIRLIRASGDYISQYHEETRLAYSRAPLIELEYRQDEYHRHWATSIGETFEFHARAFANAALDTVPTEWSYTSAQREFKVRGFEVKAPIGEPALVSLEHVTQGGFRIRTRRWAPDGPVASCSTIQVATPPAYHPGASYRILDYSRDTEIKATTEGRLNIALDCTDHVISITGPGTGAQPPILLTSKDTLRVLPGKPIRLPVSIYNPRATRQPARIEVSSEYPTVEILRGSAEWKALPSGQTVDPLLDARFTSGDGDWMPARLDFKIIYDEWHQSKQTVDVLVAPDALTEPTQIEILDGRTKTFSVFKQKGNQGGGTSIMRTVTEGSGNGNGILEPGEKATIWIRLKQGLDPFDKNNWCRTKVFSDSPWLTEAEDIQEDKQREWTSAQSRTSVIALSPNTPPDTSIPVVLDCESYSFHFTPDVRYGREPLYQAFQLHKHHLFSWTWKAGSIISSKSRRTQ